MINNRQGGRRRGRGGGQRPPNNMPSGGGNRQDNRQRGNAAQLLEKYKSLARDMQLAGDRVQTEYYLQFADHYHRVLSENRSRFEDNRRNQGDFSDEDEGEDEGVTAEGYREERQERPERGERPERQERRPQREFRPREQRGDSEPAAEGEPRQADTDYRNGGDEQQRPRRQRLQRRDREEASGAEAEERIALEVLPPAIGATAEADEPAAPRRRTRRPRPAAEGEEIAPAA